MPSMSSGESGRRSRQRRRAVSCASFWQSFYLSSAGSCFKVEQQSQANHQSIIWPAIAVPCIKQKAIA